MLRALELKPHSSPAGQGRVPVFEVLPLLLHPRGVYSCSGLVAGASQGQWVTWMGCGQGGSLHPASVLARGFCCT